MATAPCPQGKPRDAPCAYLAAVHAKLHTPYKLFVGNLPPYGPLADPLSVELALAIDGAGRLASAQVARSSGQTSFDDGVLATLHGVATYPAPPASLRTQDGRVHLLWSFDNGYSGCGIWNARVIGERR